VNAEFNWWLLIVGLVVGAGLVWFVVMDSRRREVDIDATELPREAAWLSAQLAEDGFDVPPEATARLLLLHRDYLGAPPPDEPPDDEDPSPDPEREPESDVATAPGPAERAGPTAEPTAPTAEGRRSRRGRQRRPTSTGSASSEAPSTSAIETPNVDPAGSDATAGTSPTQ
jgi:hypothetical protein